MSLRSPDHNGTATGHRGDGRPGAPAGRDPVHPPGGGRGRGRPPPRPRGRGRRAGGTGRRGRGAHRGRGAQERADHRSAPQRGGGPGHGVRVPRPLGGQRQQRGRLCVQGDVHPRRPSLHRGHPRDVALPAGARIRAVGVPGSPPLLSLPGTVERPHASWRVFVLPAVLLVVLVLVVAVVSCGTGAQPPTGPAHRPLR